MMKVETLSFGPHGKLKESWLAFVLQPKIAVSKDWAMEMPL